MARVAVLGGSGVATPELVAACLQQPDLSQPIELVLIGRSAGKLAKVTAVCRMLAEGHPRLTVSSTVDVALGLEGADYVINQVRVGGLQARAFDESFPNEFGLAIAEPFSAGS